MKGPSHFSIGALAALAFMAPTIGGAQSISVGAGVSPTTIDPQMSYLSSDAGYYANIFDALFRSDRQMQSQPSLATAMTQVDDLTWEVDLRENVTFHDGSVFDANDVIFTFARVGKVPGNDGLLADLVSPISKIEAVDPLKLRIITKEPTPDLMRRLTTMFIISDQLPIDVKTEDFNSGQAAIGTGIMKLVSWNRGASMMLQRNDAYWGTPAAFSDVTIKEITSDSARVAALQAGDVDLIDYVPPLDAITLEKDPGIKVWKAPSARTIFMQVDSVSAQPQSTTAKDGSLLPSNPFADIRVRQALNMSINREIIREKILEGLAFKSNQGVAEGFTAFDPTIPKNVYDVDAAKELLTEAGYPDGFRTMVACPNDRYIKDAVICQAVAQMWSQLGLELTVEPMPKAVYFGKLRKGEFPIYMLGWGNNDGEGVSWLKSVASTRNADAGTGSWNPAYSNPAVDKQVAVAVTDMNAEARSAGMKKAMSMVMADVGMIPLHTQPVITATRPGFTYSPSPDEQLKVENMGVDQ